MNRTLIVLSDDYFYIGGTEDGEPWEAGPYKTLQEALRAAGVDVSVDLFGIAAVMADPEMRSYPFNVARDERSI